MALAGIGAGINELTALAVTAELAPTRKRGKYVAILVFTIIPFCPSVLWAQLIASKHGWRYCGALCGAWAAFGLLMTLVFYFPPPRVNSQGLSKAEVIKQIDFVGGFLSVAGLLLFMAGLQWGGYQVCISLGVLLHQPCIDSLIVLLAQCTCSCPSSHRRRFDHSLSGVGMEIRQVSHVPKPSQAESKDPHAYSDNYGNIRRQLLLGVALLANTGIQCLRPRSNWCGYSGAPNRL